MTSKNPNVIPLPQWETARKKRKLRLSPTQIEQKRRCERLWWFDRVRKLPQPPQGKPQTYGTVLHSVAERYLRADDLGRGEDGNPVNLYPDGWHIARNKFTGNVDGEVSDAEQGQIKKLVSAAIENGVLERRPERAVEREFLGTLLTKEDCGTHVEIIGFIDLEHVGEVQDHKTTSSTRWMKSARALRTQTPMLIYAKQHLELLRERRAAVPEEISLRYNYFCKDWKKPEVRKVECRVSIAEIEEAWEQVLKDAQRMVWMRDNVEDGLSEISDPVWEGQSPCMAYGGCPFQMICSKTETVAQYEKRIDKYRQEGYVDPQRQADRPAMFAKSRTPTEDQTMSKTTDFASRLAEKRNQKKNGVKAPAMTPPAVEPEPAPAKEPETPPAETTVAGSPPPWASAECPACKGCGFNTKGSACAICQHKSGVASALYTITANDDGTVTWINKEDTDNCGVSPLPGAQVPAVATEKDAATEPQREEVTEPTKPARKPRTRKKAAATEGFTLLINCAPLGPVETTDLHDLLGELGATMAEGVEDAATFYDINAFDRRDALRKAGKEIADGLSGLVVACGLGTGESDLKALVDGIRPHATMVFSPVA